jgi:hypothetical protein
MKHGAFPIISIILVLKSSTGTTKIMHPRHPKALLPLAHFPAAQRTALPLDMRAPSPLHTALQRRGAERGKPCRRGAGAVLPNSSDAKTNHQGASDLRISQATW